jgi:hypothetical protein
MKTTLAALLLAAATLTTGCLFSHGQFDLLGSGTAFDESQERFSRLVRWGYWEKAAEMVAPEDREHFLEAMSSLGDIKFTDWEVVVMDVAKGFHTADVDVRLEGYRESTLIHYEGVMTQHWELKDAVRGSWMVRPDVDGLVVAFAGH